MFFSLKEVSMWSGMSVAELFWQVACFSLFSVGLVLKLENYEPLGSYSWWQIFLPLFVAKVVNAYFVIIVFIRSVLVGEGKKATQRIGLTLVFLSVWAIFDVLICQNLEQSIHYTYPEIMAPLFIMIVLVAIRAK